MRAQPEVVRSALLAGALSRVDRRELRERQDRALRRLMVHAYEQVPFYRALFDRHRLHPRHIRGVRDLELIPFTSKAEMLRRPERERLAAGLDPERMLRVRTSGSSGEPFTIRRTWLEDKVQYLVRLRALRSLGVGPGARTVVVGIARPGDGGGKQIGRTLRALGLYPRERIDGLQEPEEILRRLAGAAPDLLVGYPGMLDRLTAPELAPLQAGVRPRLILTGGEVLTGGIRSRLERAFSAPVRETYASHEFPLMACSCPEGSALHVCEDGVLLEVLQNGEAVGPGERGEVVVTNLHAYAMPFIRYRLGDLATRGTGCRCGRDGATIGAVQGRMIDFFPLPDGRMLHPYEIVHKILWGGSDWIRRYQLVQERTDRILLQVVPAPGAAEQAAELERAVRPLVGPAVEFRVELVDRIPFSESGKLRPSRSLVRSEYDGLAWPGPAGCADA